MMVWKIKNHVDPVILSENILALCPNNYEPIGSTLFGWLIAKSAAILENCRVRAYVSHYIRGRV